MNLDVLAEAYLRNLEEDFWAWEEVHRVVEADLDDGWKLVLLLLERAASERDIQYVAAGPLEDLIDRNGHKALDLVEEECKNNTRLRCAIGTVGVLFYYDEFERWYGLLYAYGLRKDRVADSATIGKVMAIMKSWLSEGISVYDYAEHMAQALDKPFDDKSAQRILQKVREDVEVMDSKRPPGYHAPRITRSDLRTRVEQAVADLEHLGYRADRIGWNPVKLTRLDAHAARRPRWPYRKFGSGLKQKSNRGSFGFASG